MEEKPKKIEIVSGDSSDLDISPVYDHLNVAKPKTSTTNDKIVIPKVKKKEDKKESKKE